MNILAIKETPRLVVHCSKNSIPTVKHGGGSIMLWRCFSISKDRESGKKKGIMNSAKYREIPEEDLFQSFKDMKLGRKFTSQ